MISRQGFVIRRILLAIDASDDCTSALEEVSRLAARLDAEVAALFIEDVNVLRSAALPFARRFVSQTQSWRAFDSAEIEQEMRSRARQSRQALEAAAARDRLRWSFQVVRGRLEAEIGTAALDGDLVVVARRVPAPQSAVRLGTRTARSVLLMSGALRMNGAAVVYDGSAGAEGALAAALRFAETRVLVLLAGQDPAALRRRAEETLAGQDLRAEFRVLRSMRVSSAVAASIDAGAGVLVVAADSPLLGDPGAERALELATIPVLFARPSGMAAEGA